MKPEMILQSDLLDILFNGKNKAYGAYTLRKGYASRLTFSMAIIFFVVLLLSLLKLYGNPTDPNTSPTMAIPVIDVKIDKVNFPDKKEPQKTVPPKKIKQVANPTIQIVPDHLADKPVKPVKELDNAVIGLADIDGEEVPDAPPLIVSPISGEGGDPLTIAVPEHEPEHEPLTHAEEMPEFPGGREAFQRFMLRHLNQPEDLEHGQKIVVRIKFIVDEEGYIKNVEVLESGGSLDNEVVRVVNKMPRWKPGKQNGKLVPVYFQLPVTFMSMD